MYEETSDEAGEAASLSVSWDTPQQHTLFLLEVLVDTLALDPCAVSWNVLDSPTSVTIRFLKFPPLDITEGDFDSEGSLGRDRVRFNSGKSLIFALNQQQCDDPPPLFVELNVSKKTSPESDAREYIGNVKICIAQLFAKLIEIARHHPGRLPASKGVEECYKLQDCRSGNVTGEIVAHIALTCLGPNIITEFQAEPSQNHGSFQFRRKDGQKTFQLTRIGLEEEMKNAEDHRNRDEAMKDGMTVAACKGVLVSQDNTDPEKDCFILRVGDKGPTHDRGKIILELKTPKQKINPVVLPPYHEEVATQFPEKKPKRTHKKKKQANQKK